LGLDWFYGSSLFSYSLKCHGRLVFFGQFFLGCEQRPIRGFRKST
jgi:hypothetical protein